MLISHLTQEHQGHGEKRMVKVDHLARKIASILSKDEEKIPCVLAAEEVSEHIGLLDPRIRRRILDDNAVTKTVPHAHDAAKAGNWSRAGG